MRTPQLEELRLRHALNMTMGLDWIEATPATGAANDESRMHLSGNACRYVLNRQILAKPGQQFLYSTGALALVSAILHRATGQPLDEFARAKLFSPLGISGEAWSRIGLDTDAGGGLYLRPIDMTRIGQLVLDGGRWNDRQIFSKAWIEASTAPPDCGDQRSALWLPLVGWTRERVAPQARLDRRTGKRWPIHPHRCGTGSGGSGDCRVLPRLQRARFQRAIQRL